jgi:hypothetical protein
MSNAGPKVSKRTQRFEEIVRGASHGVPAASISYDILSYVHMLNDPESEGVVGMDMVASDLRTKFGQFADLRQPGVSLDKDPHTTDIAKVAGRKKLWDAPHDVQRIVESLRELGDEFATVSGSIVEYMQNLRARRPRENGPLAILEARR